MGIQFGHRDNPDQSAGFECNTTHDSEGYKRRIYVFSNASVQMFVVPKLSGFYVVKSKSLCIKRKQTKEINKKYRFI